MFVPISTHISLDLGFQINFQIKDCEEKVLDYSSLIGAVHKLRNVVGGR